MPDSNIAAVIRRQYVDSLIEFSRADEQREIAYERGSKPGDIRYERLQSQRDQAVSARDVLIPILEVLPTTIRASINAEAIFKSDQARWTVRQNLQVRGK